ncbi:MAG: hypothetical protein FWG10_10895 [Eubacteriaceae bacterium]|nr:hypothetical protein [Eubacteriaceae bacterium]
MAQRTQASTKENFFKAINHIEPDYIPKKIQGSNSLLAFAGMTFMEAEYDPEKTEQVLRNLFDRLPCDVGNAAFNATPKAYAALDNMTETFLAPDGVTLQHLQRPPMKPDEYPLLIADLDRFVKDTLLPRKFPPLFASGKEAAKDKIKTIVDETAGRATGHMPQIQKKLFEEYGFFPYPTTLPRVVTPIDVIFDRMRGFVGTIADLRRRPEEVKAALDVIYKVRATDYKDTQVKEQLASYMAHIPCYLNQKQYDEFFWPYFKEQVNGLSETGNKMYVCIEGRWLRVIESFLDLPKDSVYTFVDDDEILELNKIIGHHHPLVGGMLLQNTKLQPLQYNIDYAKKVIDECASGGGFVFGCNKHWICKGDINENVVDVFKFVDEYGRK